MQQPLPLQANSANALGHDSRGVANLLLDLAAAQGLAITHIALQKLLYFSHGQHLIVQRRPLVAGEFEAWEYGPVHPVVYASFKDAGARPIEKRAVIRDHLLRTEALAAGPSDPAAVEAVSRVVTALGRLPAHRLIELSHAPNGPWRAVVDKARTRGALGLRIPDKLISERFYQLIPMSAGESKGGPSEDAPLT